MLSNLASSKKAEFKRIVIQETLVYPSIDSEKVTSIDVVLDIDWMEPIIHYLQSSELSQDELEAKKTRKRAAMYALMGGKLYKMGITTPILRCLGEQETTLVLAEFHQGVCVSHIGGRALTHKH